MYIQVQNQTIVYLRFVVLESQKTNSKSKFKLSPNIYDLYVWIERVIEGFRFCLCGLSLVYTGGSSGT